MIIPDDIVDHLGKIWSGEYDIKISKEKLTILDIGANVGAFAFWALVKWPDSIVTCFEPVPHNFELLKHNLAAFKDRCGLNQLAVSRYTEISRDFFLGQHNCGEGSFFKDIEQSDNSIKVNTVSGSEIPAHDLVKIDAEGAEIEILESLTFKPYAYLIEYHSPANRRKILELLGDDYILLDHKIYHVRTGIMKFAKADTFTS